MERIGDESLTLTDSGFVHGHIFRLFWNTVLDAESAAIKIAAVSQKEPAPINLHEESVEHIRQLLGKLLLTLEKMNKS